MTMKKLIFEGFDEEVIIPVDGNIKPEEINELPIINDLLVKELDIYTYTSQLLEDENISDDVKLRLKSINEDTANIIGKLQYNLKEVDTNVAEGEDEMSETVD